MTFLLATGGMTVIILIMAYFFVRAEKKGKKRHLAQV